MMTRRTMVWLLLFLVTVPTVAAAADAVGRSRGQDMFVEIPPLREGERYVYDLHFSSEMRGMESTTQRFLVVEVGHVTRHTLLDGNVVETLPVTTTTGTAPWRAADAASSTEVVVQYLRIPDGQVVATETHRDGVDYMIGEDGTVDRIEQEFTAVQQHERENSGISYHGPGRRYTNTNEVVHIVLMVSGLSDGHKIDGRGTFGGETVYNVDAGRSTSRSSGSVGCSTEHPRVSYSDVVEDHDGPFFGKERSSLWVTPRYSFPVTSSCDATFVDSAGDHIERLKLELVLNEHVPGGRAVAFSSDPLPLPTNTPLPSVPAALPGLPAQGDLDLLFPVDDAVQVLLTAPELVRFRDEGPIPFLVRGFDHDPHSATRRDVGPDPTGPMPDPLGLVPPDTHGDAPRVDAVWEFQLTNAAGESMDVVIDRAFDAAGDVVDEELTVTPTRKSSAHLFDFPTHLPTLASLLQHHGRLTGTDVSDWPSDPSSVVRSSSSLNTMTNQTGEHRTLHLSTAFHGAVYDEATEEWTSTTSRYDLRTGAPSFRMSGVYRSDEVADVPHGRAPPVLQTASVVPASHVPAAAAASGLAVALAFVAAYFWDALGRVVIAPLYAKIHKSKVLDHATRDRIVDYVAANPGATLGAVREHLGSGYGTVVHHLGTLERNGLLISRKVGRVRSYFPAGTLSPQQMDATATAGTVAASRFLELVMAEPGLTQGEIAARLGVADSSVRYQARRLLVHAQIRAERDGRKVRYYAERIFEA